MPQARKRRQPNRFERRRVVQDRTPLSGEMGGTRTVTTTEIERQTPDRPQAGSRGPRSQGRPVREYLPTSAGQRAGSSVGALEAEFFGALFLIFITVFTDKQSSYSAKMLAVMKRGTLVSVLFFILALMSAGSENMGRVAKAIGALVIAGIFLSTAGQGTVSVMDTFFKADWATGDQTQGHDSSQAKAGQQTPGPVTAIGEVVQL